MSQRFRTLQSNIVQVRNCHCIVCVVRVSNNLYSTVIIDLFTLGNRILYVNHLVERPHLRKVKSATIFIEKEFRNYLLSGNFFQISSYDLISPLAEEFTFDKLMKLRRENSTVLKWTNINWPEVEWNL